MHYGFLQLQRKQIRKSVKKKMLDGIPKEMLVMLKFTQAEKTSRLKWKHSREFEFEGEMYDIYDSENHGDTTYYWCYWDKEETQLNRQIAGLMDFAMKKNARRLEQKQQLNSFYFSLYFVGNKVNELTFKTDSQQFACHLISFYQSVLHTPLLPPPKNVFL